jgi:outer membrane immunogenic protein
MGQVVFGLEGDGDWSNLRGSGLCAGLSCETRNNWLATARGRLGYSFGRVMPYVTRGGAFGDIKSSLAGFGSQTTTRA